MSDVIDTRARSMARTRHAGSGLDKLIADLHEAGLVTVGRDRDGHATWTLTHEGARLADLVTAWHEDGPTERVRSLLDAFARTDQ